MCNLELWRHLKCSCSKARPQQTPLLPELWSWGGSGTATEGWVHVHGDMGTTAWSIHSWAGAWRVSGLIQLGHQAPRVGDDTQGLQHVPMSPLPSLMSTPVTPVRLTERITQTVEITKHVVDIEEKGVKLRLTIVDTPGFGDAVNNTEW